MACDSHREGGSLFGFLKKGRDASDWPMVSESHCEMRFPPPALSA